MLAVNHQRHGLSGLLKARALPKQLLCAAFALSLAAGSLRAAVPRISTSSGSASFVAGDNVPSTPVTADPGVTVNNPSPFAIQSGAISITSNFHSGEDVLAFTNDGSTMGNIAGSYVSGAGALTLTSAGNSASNAQWQAAFRAVTYTDTAVTPNNATRTIGFNFTITVPFTTGTATRTVTVTDTEQTPIVTTTGGTTLNYVGSAATIDSGVTVSDGDNNTQTSGTVSITGGFVSGDILAFTNDGSTMGNIAGSYSSGTGVLTLTSSGAIATNAQWAAAFRAVTFSSTNSSSGNRTISFVVNDGTKTSPAATDTVSITGPIVTADSGSAAFVAGDNVTSTPVAVDGGITLLDGNSSIILSATVSITGNFQSGEDVLAFTNTSGTTYGNISASYTAGTGVLVLTSSGNTATLPQWQAALEAITYTDTAITPSTSTRTISFQVTDGNSNTNNTATRTVTVADTDQTPIATTTTGATNYVAGSSAAAIDSGVTVTDRDNTTFASATVSISIGFAGGDTLAFTNTSATTYGNISASYNSGTGVLTLTSSGATATLTQWTNALQAVTFSTGSSASPGSVTISFAVSDGIKTSAASTKKVNLASVSASYAAPAPDGYAASATGGTGSAVTVLTAADFRTQATSATPAVITVAGVIDLGSTPVNVASNKTIQGADADSSLIGNLTLGSGVSNVVIRGLNLTNPGTTIVGGAYTDGGDAFTLSGANTIFITHCTFFDTANHAIEIINGSDNITISWCEFYYTTNQTVHRYSLLIGQAGSESAVLHVTLHHNYWSTRVDQRMPLATFGYVHLYSNYFATSGNTSATVSSDQSQLLSELNVYDTVASPLTVQNVNTALPIGRSLALNNTYTATTGTAAYTGTDQVFTPTYSYEALPTSDVAAVISADAGNIAGAGYADPPAGSATITGPSSAVTGATAFTLTAVVPASFIPSTYQWRLNNLPISGATGSTYAVSSAQSTDAGIYTVAIDLVSSDQVVSKPFTVTITAPPSSSGSGSGSSDNFKANHSDGGAPSEWFYVALALLATLGRFRQRRNIRMPRRNTY
ncbi:MAG TPA: hypothetical protein VK717_00585 [Opitutaceae bacterium]|nr:hypothetical protein [Opitutaceae bacterium]